MLLAEATGNSTEKKKAGKLSCQSVTLSKTQLDRNKCVKFLCRHRPNDPRFFFRLVTGKGKLKTKIGIYWRKVKNRYIQCCSTSFL